MLLVIIRNIVFFYLPLAQIFFYVYKNNLGNFERLINIFLLY
jgi:hypothetical protein